MQKFLVIIFGIIFIAVGIFIYYRNSYLIKNCTIETKATVVDMKEEFSSDSDSSGYMYYPIIEYKVKEDTLKVTMNTGSSRPSYSIGEEITIFYNPNKTNEFIVKGDKTSNMFSVVFIAIGLFITGYGIKAALKKE